MGLEVLSPVGDCLGGIISHSMRLDISLVDNIDSILVAEIVPTGIVGIVGSTDCVDIEFLEHFDIIDHIGLGHYVTRARAEFVTVGAFDKDGLAIDKKLGILYLDSPESETYRGALAYPFPVGRGDLEGIERRGLSRP